MNQERRSAPNAPYPPLGKLLSRLVADLQVEDPRTHRVLVLSPHPDDDAIGCGGTLARLAASGCKITVLYLTDGARGDPSGTYTESQLVELREQEAKAASKVLGIENLIFLRRPDGNLQADGDTVAAVRGAISDSKPDLVYLPSFIEGLFHHDHLQASVILEKIASEGNNDFACYAYETHTPLIPNRLVDITAQAKLKQRAIEQHKTQMRIRPYSKILRLNEYRAAFLGPPPGEGRYVEAFLRAAPTTYFKLFHRFLQDWQSTQI
jgi:LmbE family N-acetylglucosaminyl deacetylase